VSAVRPITPGLFVDGADGPRLLAGRCRACGKTHFPRGPLCPYCGADEPAESRVGPAGRLKLFTAVLAKPPGYRGEVPYGFGVVELEGGLEVITRLTESRLDRLHAGLAMRLAIAPLFADDDGTTVLTWAFAPEPA
jgi:uncharacterized OB-fold protein